MDVQGQFYNIQTPPSALPSGVRPKRAAPTRADALAGKTLQPIKQSNEMTKASALKVASTYTVSEKDLQDLDMISRAVEELQKSFEEEPVALPKQSAETLPDDAKTRRAAPKRARTHSEGCVEKISF